MATITYKCSICDRNIDLLENPIGLTTFSKCVITYGCKGKLLSIKRNQDNIRESFPAEVPGLIDYSPRNVLSNFNQTVPLTTWIITHNLNTNPAVTVYVDNNTGSQSLLDINEYKIVSINANQLKLVFNAAYSGTAQLISRNSIKIDPTATKTSTSLTQVTSNGTFVFAIPKYLTKFTYPPTILPPPDLPYDLSAIRLRIEVSIQKPNEEATICTEFINADLNGTSWNGWNSILIRKRKNYYLFSINILNFRTFGGDTTKFSDIPDGTQLKITRVDYGTGVLQPVDTEGLFIMLSNSPYTINDKIKDLIIDVGDMVNNDINYFTYNGSDFFVDSSNVDKTYPDISKVNPVIPIIAPIPSVTPTVTPTITLSMTPSPTPQITVTPTPIPLTLDHTYLGLQSNGSVTTSAIPFSKLARINGDGSMDTLFTESNLSDVNGYINTLFQSIDNKIYIGGASLSSTDLSYTNIIRLNSDGTLDTSFVSYDADNAILSIIQATDNKIYIGGYFSSFNNGGANYPRLVRLNSDGTLDTTFAAITFVNGDDPSVPSVNSMFQSFDGKIYIGGKFTTVNGNTYRGVCRLNSDGTVDTTLVDIDTNYINHIIQSPYDNKIYVSGNVASTSNIYNYFKRLNSDGTLDTTFTDLELSGGISKSFIDSNSKIYILGNGNDIILNSVNYYNTARLNADGTVDTTFEPLGNSDYPAYNIRISAACQIDDKIYVSGAFAGNTYNSTISVIRLNIDGTIDDTFIPSTTDDRVTYIISSASGKVYFGGEFLNINIIPEFVGLNRLNVDGTFDNTYSIIKVNYTDGALINNIKLINNFIYITGNFTDNNGIRSLSRLNPNGSLDNTFNDLNITYDSDPASAFLESIIKTLDNKIYIGGSFNTISNATYTSLARLNSNGTLDSTFVDLGIDSDISSMIQAIDDKIYIGGSFSTIDSVTYNYLARLNSDGTLDNTFVNLNINDSVFCIFQNIDNKIYISGNFNAIGESPYATLARLNADGTLDETFTDLACDDYVNGITSINNSLFVYGSFNSMGGNSYTNLARLYPDGSVDTNFVSLNFDDEVTSMAIGVDNNIYVGGSFNTVNGLDYKGLIRLNSDGTLDTTFVNIPYTTGGISKIS